MQLQNCVQHCNSSLNEWTQYFIKISSEVHLFIYYIAFQQWFCPKNLTLQFSMNECIKTAEHWFVFTDWPNQEKLPRTLNEKLKLAQWVNKLLIFMRHTFKSSVDFVWHKRKWQKLNYNVNSDLKASLISFQKHRATDVYQSIRARAIKSNLLSFCIIIAISYS